MGLSHEKWEKERQISAGNPRGGVCRSPRAGSAEAGTRAAVLSCRAAVTEEKPEILPVQKKTGAADVI